MLLDSSAIIAILLAEPEADSMVRSIVASGGSALVGAPTLVEAHAVMVSKKGPAGEVALDALLEKLDVSVEPMSVTAAKHARDGFVRFGKGCGSPAVLNYGDCLAYGIAMAENEPLLFKGDDFSQTDVKVAEY